MKYSDGDARVGFDGRKDRQPGSRYYPRPYVWRDRRGRIIADFSGKPGPNRKMRRAELAELRRAETPEDREERLSRERKAKARAERKKLRRARG